jgi:NAD-dependent dihydropyrimidine dehydrogenase PreA subunit
VFIREARRTDSYSFYDLLHGYFYARWPYLYIGVGVGEHPLARAFARINAFLDQFIPHRKTATPISGNIADTYHGKVVTTESAGKLLRIKEPIEVRNLEQVIPYPIAKDIIMSDPDHIVALECPCRRARDNPCTPLDVCLIVGEPFASFVIEHHPDKARWIDAEDGMGILEAEAERGHVHHAFFKDAMLGRFYAICNCCSCCCGAMQLNRNGIPMLASSGYLSVVDVERCGSCGSCVEICPFGAISFDGQLPEVHFEECMGCGVCVKHCPDDALRLVTEPQKGVPLEMDLLLQSDGFLF